MIEHGYSILINLKQRQKIKNIFNKNKKYLPITLRQHILENNTIDEFIDSLI